MIRTLNKIILPALALLIATPAMANGHDANYYVHYECQANKNTAIIKTYQSDLKEIDRPKDDISFDIEAGKQSIFECPLNTGDAVFFKTVYGSPAGRYGHIEVSVNNLHLTQDLEFNPDHSETLQVKAVAPRRIELVYLNELDQDRDAKAASAREAVEAPTTLLDMDGGYMTKELKLAGVYGWGEDYKGFKERENPRSKTIGVYNWGPDYTAFHPQPSGNGSGVYGWGPNYTQFRPRDPMHGSGPWGWGPSVVGANSRSADEGE